MSWLASATPVEATWEALDLASGDVPYLLDEEDLVEAERWAIADVPIASILRGVCKESAAERESRLAAIRAVPVETLFRPILELLPDGSVHLIDGGHRMDVALERGLATLSCLVKIVRN